MTQALLVRRYMTGPLAPIAPLPPVGAPAPSFHRLGICSPGCSQLELIDPADCNIHGFVYGNIWCYPAHVGGVNVGVNDVSNRNSNTTGSVANFQGRYYGWNNGHIWQFNPVAEAALAVGVTPTGSPSGDPGGFTTVGVWTLNASPGSIDGPSNTRSRHTGFYPMLLSGVPFLTTAVHSSANTWRSVRLNGQTGTWESGTISAPIFSDYTVANGSVNAEVRWRNFVLFITTERAEIKVYYPLTEQFARIPLPSDLRFPMDMCVFHDKPYLLCKNSAGDIVIYEISIGGISKVLTLISANLTGGDSADNFAGRNALFVDLYNQSTPRMIAINFMRSTVGGNPGFEQWEIAASGAGGSLVNNGRLHQNIQGFHFPFDQGHTVDGSNATLTEGMIWRVFNDGKFNIDARPEVYLEFRNDGGNGATYESFFWQGSTSLWVNVGGVQEDFSFSYAHEKGGDLGSKSANPFQTDCYIRKIEPIVEVSGNLKIEYVMENTVIFPNGTPMAVRFLYDVDGHSHRKVCTIVNASSGTISDNRILIPVDSGVVRTVEWDYLSDGFEVGDSVYIHTHISSTGVT